MTVVQLIQRLEKLRAEGHGGKEIRYPSDFNEEDTDIDDIEVVGDEELGDIPYVRVY